MLYVPHSARKNKPIRNYLYTDGREYDYADMLGLEVGVFQAVDKQQTVLVYGYGKLAGFDLPVDALNELGLQMVANGQRCPKIELETGSVIWGCEAFWIDREAFDHLMDYYAGRGYRLLSFGIDQYRKAVSLGG